MDPTAAAPPDVEYELPCVEALLAGTLALMTGHAQACCENHRCLMTCKIVFQLGQLAEHPVLSPPFRAALGNLRTHWQLLQDKGPRPAPDPRLWHAGPETVQ